VVQKDAGTYARGDQLAPWRTRRDSAGRRTHVALSAIQGPALAVWRPWLEQAVVWRSGALRLAERGLLAGATRSEWKRTRQGEGMIPLQAHRLAPQEAMARAALAGQWAAPPARAEPTLAWGRGVEPLGPEWHGPRNAWVMRCWQKQKKRLAPSVLVTTALERSAVWMGRHDAERPESAQADEQMQSDGWQLQKLSATR
jgi:hypothetical protein